MSSDENKKTSQIEGYRLSHPELMSEETLREVLENTCIVLPDFENLSRHELIEIFRRIALPLAQRRYDESTHLGRTLSDLRTQRCIPIADYSDNSVFPPASSQPGDANSESHRVGDSSAKGRLKPPITDNPQSCKKIRLSNSSDSPIMSENDSKRKCEVSTLPDLKKRQKITWP